MRLTRFRLPHRTFLKCFNGLAVMIFEAVQVAQVLALDAVFSLALHLLCCGFRDGILPPASHFHKRIQRLREGCFLPKWCFQSAPFTPQPAPFGAGRTGQGLMPPFRAEFTAGGAKLAYKIISLLQGASREFAQRAKLALACLTLNQMSKPQQPDDQDEQSTRKQPL